MSEADPAATAPPRDLTAEIQALEAAGELPRALDALDAAIAADPRNPALFNWKGQVSSKLGRPLDAEESLLRALEIDPNDRSANFHLGLVYDDLGIWEKSVRRWERAIELIPDLTQPYFQAGAVYGLCLRQFDRAFRLFDCLPNVIDGYWLSIINDIRRERDAARTRARAALKARHEGEGLESATGVQLVLDLLHLGRPRTAQGVLDRITPGISLEARLSAQFAIDWRVNEVEAALANIARHIDFDDPPVELRFMLSDALYQLGDVDRAAAVWRRFPLDGLAPHEQESFFRAAFAARNYPEALRIGRAVLAARPHDTKGAQYVLSTLLAQGVLTPTNSPVPDADAPEMRIPPVLFRFWDKPSPPPDVQAVLDSWNDPAEGFEPRLFDEVAARRFIADAYHGRYLAAFDNCHHPAMKSDFLRLCYLNKMGGVYLDVDQARIPGAPSLRRSMAGRSMVLPLSTTSPFYTNNNIIAATPAHPVLALALQEALELIEDAVRTGVRPNIWVSTGPGVFTRSLIRYLFGADGTADPAERAGNVTLFSGPYLDSMTALMNELAYKASAAGNWRLI